MCDMCVSYWVTDCRNLFNRGTNGGSQGRQGNLCLLNVLDVEKNVGCFRCWLLVVCRMLYVVCILVKWMDELISSRVLDRVHENDKSTFPYNTPYKIKIGRKHEARSTKHEARTTKHKVQSIENIN